MVGNLSQLRKCFQPWQWFSHDGEPDPTIFSDEESFMWVYRTVGDGFEVGYFLPDRTWCADSSYDTRDKAAARVHYLNGGNAC